MVRTDVRGHLGCLDDHDEGAVATHPFPGASGPEDGGALFYQRCRWCGTPAFRRFSCRACGSAAFRRERSAGGGVVVRRSGQAQRNTWFVAMDEGFNLLCQVAPTGPAVVAVGARVRVVPPVTPCGPGFPVVEPISPESPAERWW